MGNILGNGLYRTLHTYQLETVYIAKITFIKLTSPTTWVPHYLYTKTTLNTSITAPQDAHTRLVLQVYLGSNT